MHLLLPCRRHLLLVIPLLLLLSGCRGYRRMLVDEVMLQDGSSHTGTLEACDSTQVLLRKADLSRAAIPWADIDTIQPIGFRTGFVSAHLGIHATPYHSVFLSENHTAVGPGFHVRIGQARMGKHLRYGVLGRSGGQPYGVTKLGGGWQRYIRTRYVDKFAAYAGLEGCLMFIRNNNTPQISLEPFVGGDMAVGTQYRVSLRLGLQRNLMGMNAAVGVNLGAGFVFLFRDFPGRYAILNQQRRLP